jgi:hypothetical protein
MLNNNDK